MDDIDPPGTQYGCRHGHRHPSRAAAVACRDRPPDLEWPREMWWKMAALAQALPPGTELTPMEIEILGDLRAVRAQVAQSREET